MTETHPRKTPHRLCPQGTGLQCGVTGHILHLRYNLVFSARMVDCGVGCDMDSAAGRRCRILFAAIFSASLTACAMPTSGPPTGGPAPKTVTGSSYTCIPTPSGGQECTRLFKFPGNICWADLGAPGGCGSIVSNLTIEVGQDTPPGPHPWRTYYTYNYDIYNVTYGWFHESQPYLELRVIDTLNQQQNPPLVLWLQRLLNTDCGNAVPHQIDSQSLPDFLIISNLPMMSVKAVNDGSPGYSGTWRCS
jgi:hypothetical protein